ncbi:glycoside hydrolase family 79 protein [Amanita muscaria Koide BX008]|uniref:Glycoside hydrolase family 79 protein n=1 Tax=Amanita muscaria (strain Koide BX008) TaxID=946122 RepID=A0A0C2WF60_AMAMK|nr:glycoside hydrolase family 79 protein [Amanita muscaria Koide BX008]
MKTWHQDRCSNYGLHLLILLPLVFHHVLAVTVYRKDPSPTSLAPGAMYSGPAAFNPIMLQAPAPPSNFATQVNIAVRDGPAPLGSSIQQLSSFFGFSIEMSVVDEVLGRSSQRINVPFLNLMANLVRRSGRVNIRVGGNTQETAVMVQNTTSGELLEKDYENTKGTTNSPPIVYKEDLLYLLRNISQTINVRWFLGIPFNATNPYRLDIMEKGQTILRDYLLGLQAGNEPDLYAYMRKRPSNYGPMDYFGDFGSLVYQLNRDFLVLNRTMLMGPSVSAAWSPETMWNTGFLTSYSQYLGFLTFERYPNNNCAQFGVGSSRDPQQLLSSYLAHNFTTSFVAPYINSTNIAQQIGKPVIMLETNTASCGGFNGISNSFAAALWALDYGLQMAYVNFTMAMFHVGGRNVYYNPFTAPATNESSFRQWTIGPVYYSALVMAETLSNGSQVLDITTSANLNPQSPAYVIYEGGHPSRLALFNFVSDPSGAHDVQFTFSIGGQGLGQANGTPAQVKVKYLRAGSVTQKINITWAGQTFGGLFQSDGRPSGQEDIKVVLCNQAANTCTVTVYAPSYALVFLRDDALSQVEYDPPQTYSTSVATRMRNTATVNQAVLATSNGHSRGTSKGGLGRTSLGIVSVNGAPGRFSKTRLKVKVLGCLLIVGGCSLL